MPSHGNISFNSMYACYTPLKTTFPHKPELFIQLNGAGVCLPYQQFHPLYVWKAVLYVHKERVEQTTAYSLALYAGIHGYGDVA